MPRSKTLFDAVEAEMRNARAAINNAGAHLNMLKDAVKETYNSAGMEAPLSVLVKTENGEYGIPIAIDSEDESMIHMLRLKDVSKKLREHQKLLWQ
jgi:hypothetical protein